MSFYLSAALASNRKGRFLQSVAGAQPLKGDWLSSPPESGLILLETVELIDTEVLMSVYNWAMQPGCAALLIDPQNEPLAELANLPTPIDWAVTPATLEAEGAGLTEALSDEITEAINGFAGSADHQLHMAGDVAHTRYIRKHSNSGLFALTTLPLWSLSLLDHSDSLMSWLNWFSDHAGIASLSSDDTEELANYSPDKYDLVALLLLYAGNGSDINTLVSNEAVKLMFNIEGLDVLKRCEVLQEHGYINDAGLTERGQASLQASSYWTYAPLLSEQLNTGVR